MTTTLREEIIDILKDVYYNNDGGDPFDEGDADRILKVFEKRIESIDIDPYHMMEWYCKKAVEEFKEEIKEMLK